MDIYFKRLTPTALTHPAKVGNTVLDDPFFSSSGDIALLSIGRHSDHPPATRAAPAGRSSWLHELACQ
jgi:hypothetical protein